MGDDQVTTPGNRPVNYVNSRHKRRHNARNLLVPIAFDQRSQVFTIFLPPFTARMTSVISLTFILVTSNAVSVRVVETPWVNLVKDRPLEPVGPFVGAIAHGVNSTRAFAALSTNYSWATILSLFKHNREV